MVKQREIKVLAGFKSLGKNLDEAIEELLRLDRLGYYVRMADGSLDTSTHAGQLVLRLLKQMPAFVESCARMAGR